MNGGAKDDGGGVRLNIEGKALILLHPSAAACPLCQPQQQPQQLSRPLAPEQQQQQR